MTETHLPYRVLSRPVVIIAAHPDDEILGLGTLLGRFRNLRAVVHVTDGAPRRGFDTINAGVNGWPEYAALRRREFVSAMRKAGIQGTFLICLDYPDQEASQNMRALVRRLVNLLQRFRPGTIFTHPYEGGHPDHDACAAAVHIACSQLSYGTRPDIFEFASYHIAPSGGMEAERFLGRSRRLWHCPLTEPQRQKKLSLMAEYGSQQGVLNQFPVRSEPIRMAPTYRFCKPPHRGKLYYENFNWGMTGPQWRRFARRAIAAL